MIENHRQKNKIRGKLILEIRDLIVKSKNQINISVNTAMSSLYWHIGKRINEEIVEGSSRLGKN